MTREEKSNLLNELLEYEEKNDIGNLTRAERREFQQWISKALNQESILDKIRAEIEELDAEEESVDYDYNDTVQTEIIHTVCREQVFEILDKYKAESEGKDADSY